MGPIVLMDKNYFLYWLFVPFAAISNYVLSQKLTVVFSIGGFMIVSISGSMMCKMVFKFCCVMLVHRWWSWLSPSTPSQSSMKSFYQTLTVFVHRNVPSLENFSWFYRPMTEKLHWAITVTFASQIYVIVTHGIWQVQQITLSTPEILSQLLEVAVFCSVLSTLKHSKWIVRRGRCNTYLRKVWRLPWASIALRKK